MKLTFLPDRLKVGFRFLLQPVIKFFVRLHLNPNHFTTISLLLCLIAAIYFAKGSLRTGALLLLLGGLFDMVDGDVARASNRVTKFGALYDSTLDRYAEIMIFFGIGYYFIIEQGISSTFAMIAGMAVFLGLGGSLMVSYVRARAEGLGFECKVGLMQRPERILLLSLGALISQTTLVVALVLIAVFANMTAFQRIYHIWAADNSDKWKRLSTDISHE